jgi:hypothetical protein
MMQDIIAKLNPGLPWKNSIQQGDSFHHQIGLKFKNETNEMRAQLCMVLKMEHFGT